MLYAMSTSAEHPAGVPEFDLADRMRKALRTSGVSVQDMADYLGVGRSTVSTWINGRIVPDKRTLRLWALRTGVPFEWLEKGEVAPTGNGPRDGGSPTPWYQAHLVTKRDALKIYRSPTQSVAAAA